MSGTRGRARGKGTASATACVNVFPAAAITKGLEGAELSEFGLLRDAGAVMLTEGRRTLASNTVMRRALTYARDMGLVISHATQDRELGSGVMNEGLLASWLGLPGIPREAEAIPLNLYLARVLISPPLHHHAPSRPSRMPCVLVLTAASQNSKSRRSCRRRCSSNTHDILYLVWWDACP